MRFKETNEKTKDNFKKIFDCNDHFKNKERDFTLDNIKLKEMLSSFGKGKLSVNRYMKNGDPILLYLFRMNKPSMFISFFNEFNLKITDKTRLSFITKYIEEDYIEYVINHYEMANYDRMISDINELLSIITIFNSRMKKQENKISPEKISELVLLKNVESNKVDFHEFINLAYSMYEKNKILSVDKLDKSELKIRRL